MSYVNFYSNRIEIYTSQYTPLADSAAPYYFRIYGRDDYDFAPITDFDASRTSRFLTFYPPAGRTGFNDVYTWVSDGTNWVQDYGATASGTIEGDVPYTTSAPVFRAAANRVYVNTGTWVDDTSGLSAIHLQIDKGEVAEFGTVKSQAVANSANLSFDLAWYNNGGAGDGAYLGSLSASDNSHNTGYSNGINFYVLPFSAPTLSYSSINTRSVKLAWDFQDGADNYDLTYTPEGQAATSLTINTNTDYTVSNLGRGTSGTFQVRRKNSVATGPYSALGSFYIPDCMRVFPNYKPDKRAFPRAKKRFFP